MNKKENLALFLGMLSGDGCLPIKHSGEGYRDYAIQFYNTNKNRINLFDKLFFNLFNVHGSILYSDRENKKRLWCFMKYSKEIVNKLKYLGFPEGVKRDLLRVLNSIKEGTDKEKLAFIEGVLITDGCIRKNKTIIFHSGSKIFLNELADLASEFIGKRKLIREFIQREKYHSYQLNLNKKESALLISQLRLWDNGTPIALSCKTR